MLVCRSKSPTGLMLHVVQYSTQNKMSMSSMSMFRHEILKVIIIEVPPFFSSPESVCSLHHQQLFQRTSPILLDWMGVEWSLCGPLYFFSNTGSLGPLHI